MSAAVPAVASAQNVTGVSLQNRNDCPSGTDMSIIAACGPPGSVLVGGVSTASRANSTATVSSATGSIRWSYTGTPGTPDPPESQDSGCIQISPAATGNVRISTQTTGTGGTPGRREVALPRTPGTYTITFAAFPASNQNCSGNRPVDTTFSTQVIVTPRATNPAKAFTCGGLRVALVLDESASIPAEGATETVRDAALAFVRALSDTETSVGIIPFSVRARVGVEYTEVTGTSIGSTFQPFIRNTGDFNPSGGATTGTGFNPSRSATSALGGTSGTNWDAGFATVSDLGPAPDLVVFVTDGDPNATGTAPTSITTDLDGGVDVMRAAVASAGQVKQRDSRVFAVGVGPVVRSEAGPSRLTAVSGPDAFPGTPFSSADYTIAQEFDELEASFTSIVQAICGGRLVITKRVFGPNGASQREGWRFSATLTGTPPHRWTEPPGVEPETRRTARRRTNDEGLAEFAWLLRPPLQGDERATLSVRERSRRGFRRVLSICKVRDADGEVIPSQTERRTEGRIAEGLQVPIGGWATCRVWNRRKVAHLRVVKELIPPDDLGRFDLLLGDTVKQEAVGDGGDTDWLKLPLRRRPYTVSERLNEAASPEGTTLADYEVSTRCVNRANDEEVGRGGTGTERDPFRVRLRSETARIVCTITNRRPEEPPPPDGPPPDGPPPPEGITPPPSCLDVEAGVPECGNVEDAPNLVVTKRMPARARVGDRVRIRISVQNVGRGTARAVRLFETPRGGRIVRLGQRGSIRGDGTAVWRLANLAPGERQTVRATILVTRTALHIDTATAAAQNAEPAFDVAPERVRGAVRRQPPPPVTG
jgi:hypothetical protein